MKTLLSAALVAGPLALAAHAAEAPPQTPAQQMYVRYCGACHGPTGRGDGIASSFLRPKASDLTTIARRHKGEFPTAELVAYIDGTKPVGAHGSREMPVWGEILGAEPGATQASVGSKIGAIVDYVRSVQRK